MEILAGFLDQRSQLIIGYPGFLKTFAHRREDFSERLLSQNLCLKYHSGIIFGSLVILSRKLFQRAPRTNWQPGYLQTFGLTL